MVDVLSWWGSKNRGRAGAGPTRRLVGEVTCPVFDRVFLAIDGTALLVQPTVRLGTLFRGEHAAVASIFDDRAVDACGIPFELQRFPSWSAPRC